MRICSWALMLLAAAAAIGQPGAITAAQSLQRPPETGTGTGFAPGRELTPSSGNRTTLTPRITTGGCTAGTSFGRDEGEQTAFCAPGGAVLFNGWGTTTAT